MGDAELEVATCHSEVCTLTFHSFFYERWGDAPVHSLAVGLFLDRKNGSDGSDHFEIAMLPRNYFHRLLTHPASEVIFYDAIGYMHPNLVHCPTESSIRSERQCDCSIWTSFDYRVGYSCLLSWQFYREKLFFPEGKKIAVDALGGGEK